MKLEQQVTSLEISKRLKELGVKQESLFYFKKDWYDPNPPTRETAVRWVLRCSYQEMSGQKVSVEERISAFTVAELGEMLPKTIKKQFNKYTKSKLDYYLSISWSEVDKKWRYAYVNSRENICLEMFFADTESDARGKMLIYLLENNLTPLSSATFIKDNL